MDQTTTPEYQNKYETTPTSASPLAALHPAHAAMDEAIRQGLEEVWHGLGPRAYERYRADPVQVGGQIMRELEQKLGERLHVFAPNGTSR